MQGLLRFLTYNNAVPIGLSLMTLSFGAAFAASDQAQEAMYNSQQKVVSVDNTYLVGKNLDAFNPKATIATVTEDAENYYVAYQLSTIDIIDHVWRDVTKDMTLTVAKGLLGENRDLGLYVTEQLKQVIDQQVAYLKEVQGIEKKQVSVKQVTTVYGGLIGRFMDATTEDLPGYVPVIKEPAPPVQVASAAQAENAQSQGASAPSGPASAPQSDTQPTQGGKNGDTTIPQVQVLGANPARVPVGSAYSDLGVVVQDTPVNDVAVRAYLGDSTFMQTPGTLTIDTAKDGEWLIRYEAEDAGGNIGRASRVVIVGLGNVAPPEVATSTEPIEEPIAESVSTPAPTPEVAPEPAPIPVSDQVIDPAVPGDSAASTL